MYYCNRNLSQSFTFAKSGGFHYSYRQMAKRKPAEQHAKLEIEYWPIDRLKPYERNPRKNDKAVEKMRASIREFGFSVPVLVRSSGEVIDGHLRVKGAAAEKISELPVILCDGWTDAQVKAFRLMANRSVAWAEWDTCLLATEFADLKALDFDLTLTGFDSREIDALMLAPNAAEDDAPPVPADPVTKPGDLYLLGPHRLLCGDSTSATDVARLLGDRKPFLMVTDPPYGVEYDATWRAEVNHDGPMSKRAVGKVLNDDRSDWREAWSLFPGNVAYCWSPPGGDTIRHGMALQAAGFEIRSTIIWAKSQIVFGRGHYHWQHEPCWYAVRKSANGQWEGDRKQTTLWQIDKPQNSETGHSTQKPVECMRRPILNHTKAGDAVYDPFLGSGTTLVAAELTGRECYGLELDPGYCDVIVARWEKLTGKKATLEANNAAIVG